MTEALHWIWQHPGWPAFTWQGPRLAASLAAVRQLQARLLGNVEGLAEEGSLRSELDALVQNAINTSAIEGERLNVDSVRSSVAKRLGVDRAGLPAGTPQTEGLANILLDATHNHRAPLTLQRLEEWHRSLFPGESGGLTTIRVGELRGDAPMQVVSGPIGRPRVHFEAPPRSVLDRELAAFIAWFDASRDDTTLDPLLRAGIAHLWFVTLHPFDDGNGRIARAVTDLALAQAEHRSVRFYAMAAAIMAQREAYYRVLESTQRNGLDVTDWLEWFLATLREALAGTLDRIRDVLLKARFWQQHRQTVLNARQTKVINRLLDAAPGGFEGGLTARKYMGMVQASKATATRDLTELLDKGCLRRRPGAGRSTSYEIAWPAQYLPDVGCAGKPVGIADAEAVPPGTSLSDWVIEDRR
jgi:Fic family protein